MTLELHLDLSASALRKNIFGPIVGMLQGEQKPLVAAIIDDETFAKDTHCKNIAEVKDAIDKLPAQEEAKEQAKAVYDILADAESEVHECPVEQTHFHEVGQIQTVKEIVGIAQSFVLAALKSVSATPVQTGSGKVECAHGVLDIPAPATAAILKKYNIPVQQSCLEGELCTPTSAALIAYYVEEFD